MAFSSSAPQPPPPPVSGWADLPRDILWSVFTALGQREVFSGAGLACAPWWRLARHGPSFWRRIDLTTAPDEFTLEVHGDEDDSSDEESMFSLFGSDDNDDLPFRIRPFRIRSLAWKAMALAAVNRSAGKCEAFWGRADVEVLLFLADRASSMKSLRVESHYNVSSVVFAELIKKFPLLEELELVLKDDTIDNKSQQPSTNSLELFQSTCNACCHLQHFTVRCAGKKQRSDSPTHFSIPMMHGLHSVELSWGDRLTTDVVMQIVDKCPSLKSLNISRVHYQDRWDEKLLRNKCYRIKNLRLPYGWFDDYDSVESLFDMS